MGPYGFLFGSSHTSGIQESKRIMLTLLRLHFPCSYLIYDNIAWKVTEFELLTPGVANADNNL
jgi:hypothetical protein